MNNKNEEFIEALPDKQKMILLNQNLHIFSEVYGFKFDEDKSVFAIDNQSFHPLQDIFPKVTRKCLPLGNHPIYEYNYSG